MPTLPAVPYNFTPGTTIYSAQVDADFTAIQTTALAILGDVTGGNATAGQIGEYISSDASYPGGAITSTVSANITSISLTAGDWDVEGIVGLAPAAGTTTSQLRGWVSSTSVKANPNELDGLINSGAAVPAAQISGGPTGAVRFALATTTTVYLSVNATFAVSTMQAFGFIRARRVR